MMNAVLFVFVSHLDGSDVQDMHILYRPAYDRAAARALDLCLCTHPWPCVPNARSSLWRYRIGVGARVARVVAVALAAVRVGVRVGVR